MKQAPRLVLHIPHSSRHIPADLRASFVISDSALEAELLAMTDRYTDELFALTEPQAERVVFPVSRLVVDPERFLDDASEPMAAKGMGVTYSRTSTGALLREPPAAAARQALVERFYLPHHRALERAVEAALAAGGQCLIIDCHSFPSAPLPCDVDQNYSRPDICIGTDSFHTSPALRELAVQAFASAGLCVAIDKPYAGTMVPASHYRRDRAVQSLMVEVNRKLYMDEATGSRLPGFASIVAILHRALLQLGGS